jgi:hypothetical protein
VINKAHSAPSLENGFIVNIYQADIERGTLFTDWGSYRVSRENDFHISLNLDTTLTRPEQRIEQTPPAPTPQLPITKYELVRSEDQISFTFESLPPISLQVSTSSSTESAGFSKLATLLEAGDDVDISGLRSIIRKKIKVKPGIIRD